jgi:hypothetical protein
MTFRESGYSPGDRLCHSSGMASTALIDNPLIVLILPHGQGDRSDLAISRIRDSRLFPG